MWELDHKAECQRNDVFELWYWRRLLTVTWTARRSNPSIPKEISPEYWKDWCRSWSSNALATWCEELTCWKSPWCWKRLKVGGEDDHRGWDGWMASLTQWTWVWASSGCWWWTGKPGVLQSMGMHRVMGMHSVTRLNNWTEMNWMGCRGCVLGLKSEKKRSFILRFKNIITLNKFTLK